ncbi:MAG: site-specific DNA-methyltransferase [Rhodobacteraceae bacterium]|nr:site-specific DNA-methyltransferase [Paracoccaceae bacterium]
MTDFVIKRVETIGPVRLYLGDCLEIMPTLERSDLCVTDHPYPLTSGGCTNQVMGGLFAQSNYDNSGKLMDMVGWHESGGPIYRALKDDADCYVMSNDKNIFAAHAGFTGAGFQFHNLLVWDKVRATRNRWYMKNLEFTLYLWKGAADKRGINDCGSKQSFQLNAKRTSGHPTEKPVALMAHYIENSSQPGDVVLDPFMGSGTTMLACIETGRRGVGIELDPKWFDVACERAHRALELVQ